MRSADGTYPALRPNGGYHPRPGVYKARARDAGPVEECQPLTTKEMAVLQGWPEETWAALPEGRQAAAQILGQSVPPPMAEWAARSLRRYLLRIPHAAAKTFYELDANTFCRLSDEGDCQTGFFTHLI